MVDIKKFLITHGRVLHERVPLEKFLQRIGRRTGPALDNLSGNFAYRLVFRPEGGKERISLVVVKRKGYYRREYLYRGSRETVGIVENIEKRLLDDIKEHKLERDGVEYYPVLDVEGFDAFNISVRNIGRGKLKGEKEAIIELPPGLFSALKKDILNYRDVKDLITSIESAINGELPELGEFQKDILKGAVIVLKKTGGRALIPTRELSSSEIDLIQDVMDKHWRYVGSMSRGFFLASIRRRLQKVNNIDEATRNLYTFFRKHNIRVAPTHIRKWIETAKQLKTKKYKKKSVPK